VSPLAEFRCEPVKLAWEQRFESRYGFWQGSWDDAVAHYLDCGVWNKYGFATEGDPGHDQKVCTVHVPGAFSVGCGRFWSFPVLSPSAVSA
jgi:hypothetical protein